MTKREKRKIDATHAYIDHLLEEYGGAYVMGTYMEVKMEEDLFSQIREALYGVSPIVSLRFANLHYSVSQSFDAQTSASLATKEGEMIMSFTVNRRGEGIETRHYLHSGNGPVTPAIRTTEKHGDDVVRSSVIQFIREVLS